MRIKALPVAAGLTVALLGGSAINFALAQSAAPVAPAAPAVAAGQGLPSLSPVVSEVLPSVVAIAVQGEMVKPVAQNGDVPPFFQQFGQQQPPSRQQVQGEGSGVIVDAAKGLIVTNNHVVDFANKIAVTLSDGRTLTGKVLGKDPATDIALVQVPAENLSAIKFAAPQDVRVGDYVVAVGNPFGLGETVTSGIVSALGRSGLGIEGYENFIQTDASINPGNSGGALVDLKGDLVGMNTAIVGPGGGSVGVGFAIPSQMIQQVVAQIEKYGDVERGQLGVQIQNLSPDLIAAMGLPAKQAGALVADVSANSPAAGAGLKAGDVVTELNGQAVATSTELRNEIGLMRAGDKVDLKILRDGKTIDASVTLAKAQAA
ncbi:PDZ domain-containing protein [Devosia sp. D6-9]|nr:PDZ domain-containing protein [Devosia sp. D6-9]